MKSLFIPWTLERYLNGAHPLIVSMLDGLMGQVRMTGPQKDIAVDAPAFSAHWLRLSDEMQALTGVDRDLAQRFIASRYHLSDLSAPPNSIGFHHTLVPSLRHRNIVHFETPIMFFWPEVNHGQFVKGASLVDQPFYPMIRASFAHPNIIRIVSHSLTGLRYFKSVFPDAATHAKTAYIPLLPFVQRYIERARQLPGGEVCLPQTERRRILFTNSFHGWPYSFWVRGGVTTLLAFQRVNEHIPLEITIVGALPDDLPEEASAILTSPHVRHVPRASEGELQAYYDNADVMLVPSIGLHSMSIARAICSGSYVIVYDVPGVEEFVTDPTIGTILTGTARERAYFSDAKADILLDDYTAVKDINMDNVAAVSRALQARLETASRRDTRRPAARPHAKEDLMPAVELFREVCLA